MTIDEITGIGTEVLEMLDEYKGVAGQGEFGADRVLYGYLRGRFRTISRQHKVAAGRIDFRYGGTNPIVIELVVRSPKDAQARLFASQNRPELRKLTRVRGSTARMRALLLLDRAPQPISLEALKRGYDKAHAGRGRFERHTVRVIYVHRDLTYNFPWNPKASLT